jgi:hypothetical protein
MAMRRLIGVEIECPCLSSEASCVKGETFEPGTVEPLLQIRDEPLKFGGG